MTYATQADLIAWVKDPNELIQQTDLSDPPTGAIDDSLVAAALASADDRINAYIRSVVTTPVDPVPGILRDTACAIARYLCWHDAASARVVQDYQDALAFLADVQAGKAALADASAPSDPPSAGSSQIVSAPRTFSRDTLCDF